jgi:hypothetical protein
MDWPHIAEAVSDVFELVLAIRLLRLGLHHLYRFFCIFLFFDVLTSGLALWIQLQQPRGWDYRVVWLTLTPLDWVLYIALVYVLLSALLAKFPGILSFSRKVLHFSFLTGAVIGLLTARPEFLSYERMRHVQALDRILAAVAVADRVVSMTAFLALAATLIFILWFPVQMPRNLAVFCVGLVVFFAARTSMWIVYSFGPHINIDPFNTVVLFVLSACLLYWLIFINKAGEQVPTRIGHSWNAAEQQRLLAQLEAMNATLLRAARR